VAALPPEGAIPGVPVVTPGHRPSSARHVRYYITVGHSSGGQSWSTDLRPKPPFF